MKYQLPTIVVASVLVVSLFLIALFGHRPIVLAQSPAVMHVGSATIPPELGDMIGVIDEYGVHVPLPPSKADLALAHWGMLAGFRPQPASYANMTAPAVGYSVQEWTFLGLPFGWSKSDGNVLYVSNDWGKLYAPMYPKTWETINKANGRDVTKATIYPFWNHTWGWLFVLALGLVAWLWRRGTARRREDLGLID